jgi:Transglutaminase-like superfamily/TgpA N-terminal domain/Domain of unknown function (DUF4129)
VSGGRQSAASRSATDSPLTAEPADRSVIGRLRGLFATPDEGWGSLLALVVMMLVAAFAVDEAKWIGYVAGSKTTQTSFLPVAVVLASLAGFALARSRLGTLRSHVVGATIGATYLLVAVSGAISSAPSLEERLRALNVSVGAFIGDVVVLGVRSGETSIFGLLVGALLWGAAQLGAFALFRRHRPGPAISLAATALLINMSITINDQLPHLVIFMAAALLLVVRTSLFGQLEQWRIRRIADSGYASQLFLRSGATFVAVAIVSSLVLAANASSAPLRPMWDGALERMIDLGIEVNHFIGGVNGPARGPNLLFTPTQTIREQWETSNEPVFTAITADGRKYNWRGSIYDRFDGRSWQYVVDINSTVPAFEDLSGPTNDRAFSVGRHEVLAEVTSLAIGGSVIVAPADPVRLDHEATVQTTADGGLLDIRIGQSLEPGVSYVVTSRVFDRVGPGALTAADLAAAGVQYGPEMRRYIEIQNGSIGDVTTRIAGNIVSNLLPLERDPYHVALAVQNYLHDSGGFEYDTDVTGMCTGENFIDCFLREQRGYCEYFASAMVMMLRTQQIPARYVTGFLPGRLQEDGSRLVERSASHAWVEVFFPGYGWYPFDPTPGLGDQGQEITNLPTGVPRATQKPGDSAQTPFFGPTPGSSGAIPPPPPDVTSRGGNQPLLALVIAVLVLATALLLVVAARRRRMPGGAQLAYESVARMASRFGYGPQPSQTAYEYATQLAVVVPAVREELQVVATAKVEALYGRREPSDELRRRLVQAYRRVRLSLLRLLLRRPHWLSLPRVGRRRPPPDS